MIVVKRGIFVDRFKNYKEYIRKDCRWWMLAKRIIADRGYRCERCRSEIELQVHHKTYKNLGHEEPEDLIVLCEICHTKKHDSPAELVMGAS